ncbi:MAG: cysteine desulfurase [bacterium]|nr:cysteine desulfurase [bacterium]
MRTIYLDFSTTTPVASSVRDAMLPFLNEFYGHPSSSHWFGRAAQEAIEDARSNLATLIGCHPAEVVFTSSGTESINLALFGLARSIANGSPKAPPHLITSRLEHDCVRQCTQVLKELGWQVSYVDSDADGRVSVEAFESAICESTRIASIMHASHVTGVIQPIEEISAICQDRDILLHCDAAQTVGKIPVHVDQLGVDLLSLSGHKLYAPKGVGALYVRMGVPMKPLMYGDGCEAGLRPGTPNVPHIVGLGQASRIVSSGLENAAKHLEKLRTLFRQELEAALGMRLTVHGEHANKLPHILSFVLPGVNAELLQSRLPEICFRPNPAGLAERSRGSVDPLAKAATIAPAPQESGAIQVSFGWTTTEEEIHKAAQMFAAAYEALHGTA